jgi:hypothetical protein
MSWARRLKRVFGVEIESCTRCGGKLKIIASIEEPQLIAKILSHMELAAPEQSKSELALGARGPIGRAWRAGHKLGLNIRPGGLRGAGAGAKIRNVSRRLRSDFSLDGRGG